MSSFYGNGGGIAQGGGDILAEKMYICGASEYDTSTGLPSIVDPEQGMFYLVPAGDEEENNLFNQFIYKDGEWEKFGSGGLKLDDLVVVAGTGTGSAMTKNGNTASGINSFAEGGGTTASGYASHAEGYNTTASGPNSHAEGQGGTFRLNNVQYTSGAKNTTSHSEGYQTVAESMADHSEGYQTRTLNYPPGNHAEGYETAAIGGGSHAEGYRATASGTYSHAEGDDTKASGVHSHAEGGSTIASGYGSHAEGNYTIASGINSHASGYYTVASGNGSYTEGNYFNLSGFFTSYQMKLTGNANTQVYTYDKLPSASNIQIGNQYFFDNKLVTVTALNTTNKTITINETLNTSNWTNQTVTVIKPTAASGINAHAEGERTTASSIDSHAEGGGTTASGTQSHAEGAGTIANHKSQHVFGEFNTEDPSTATANNRGNYVEIVGNGTSTSARSNARTLDWSGNQVLAGKLTVGVGPIENMDVATKQYVDQHSSSGGLQNLVDGSATGSVRSINSAAENNNYTIGESAVAEGAGTKASGIQSHAEGNVTTASGYYSHAEGSSTTASSIASHAEGYSTTASGNYAHVEGSSTIASGDLSHAEGSGTRALGQVSHAEGIQTIASSNYSHAEGGGTTASGLTSHAEGANTTASGNQSHAEGINTTASRQGSHAEGNGTTASGDSSHAEGGGTIASGPYSHAEGTNTMASGGSSHAEGTNTIANHASQHVFGEYNITDTSTAEAINRGNYVEIVGNGTSSARSNARTLDWNGNEVLAGKLTVSVGPTNDMDVATKQYVDEHAGGSSGLQNLIDGSAAGSVKSIYSMENADIGQHAFAGGYNSIASGAGAYTEGNYMDNAVLPSQIRLKLSGEKNTLEYTVDLSDEFNSSGIQVFQSGFIKWFLIENQIAEVVRVSISASLPHTGIITFKETLNSESDWNEKETILKICMIAEGMSSHAEGIITAASGVGSHAEGFSVIASGDSSHAEGSETQASGYSSHAEGAMTTASGENSHTEGYVTTASGSESHAEGIQTTASGDYAHAEGSATTASGENSHAEGVYTIANHRSQHVFGEYNIEDPSNENNETNGNYIEIVGNGTSVTNRSNARTLDWLGNQVLAGKLTVGSDPVNNMDVTTKQYVDKIFTDAVKQALLNCFAHVAWTDGNGQAYYDALNQALYPIDSIAATFSQGSTTIMEDDPLSNLKQYLTVNATYLDGHTEEVTDYTLSGELIDSTSEITVTYQGKTTTFNVTVTPVPVLNVNIGKGISYDTTQVVTNAKRCISDKVPFVNTAPIKVQWKENTDYRWALKNETAAGAMDSTGARWSPDMDSTQVQQDSSLDGWIFSGEEQTKQTSEPYASTSGYCRILFAPLAGMTADLPATRPSGYMTITGTKYKLQAVES